MRSFGPAAPVTIRRFTITDYEAVVALWAEAGLPFKPAGRDSRAAIAAELEHGIGEFLVAEISEGGPARKIVGVVIGTQDGRKGWINRLAVAPAFQGRGLARRLVREVEGRIRARGIDVIAALVESPNQGSFRFFTRIGWVHDPQIEYFSSRSDSDS